MKYNQTPKPKNRRNSIPKGEKNISLAETITITRRSNNSQTNHVIKKQSRDTRRIRKNIFIHSQLSRPNQTKWSIWIFLQNCQNHTDINGFYNTPRYNLWGNGNHISTGKHKNRPPINEPKKRRAQSIQTRINGKNSSAKTTERQREDRNNKLIIYRSSANRKKNSHMVCRLCSSRLWKWCGDDGPCSRPKGFRIRPKTQHPHQKSDRKRDGAKERKRKV